MIKKKKKINKRYSFARRSVKYIREPRGVASWDDRFGDRIGGGKNFTNFTTWREPSSFRSGRVRRPGPARIRRTGRIIASPNGARVDRRYFRRLVFGEVFGKRFFFYIPPLSPPLCSTVSRENTSIKIESRREPSAPSVRFSTPPVRRVWPRDASKTWKRVVLSIGNLSRASDQKHSGASSTASPNAAVPWCGLHACRPWCDGPVGPFLFFISSFFFFFYTVDTRSQLDTSPRLPPPVTAKFLWDRFFPLFFARPPKGERPRTVAYSDTNSWPGVKLTDRLTRTEQDVSQSFHRRLLLVIIFARTEYILSSIQFVFHTFIRNLYIS